MWPPSPARCGPKPMRLSPACRPQTPPTATTRARAGLPPKRSRQPVADDRLARPARPGLATRPGEPEVAGRLGGGPAGPVVLFVLRAGNERRVDPIEDD